VADRQDVLRPELGVTNSLDVALADMNLPELTDDRIAALDIEALQGIVHGWMSPMWRAVPEMTKSMAETVLALIKSHRDNQIVEEKRDVARDMLHKAVAAQNAGVMVECEPADVMALVDGLPRFYHDVRIEQLTDELRCLRDLAAADHALDEAEREYWFSDTQERCLAVNAAMRRRKTALGLVQKVNDEKEKVVTTADHKSQRAVASAAPSDGGEL